jgi:methionine--tRNA ligase beta chain
MEQITIEDFAKLEIKIGTIITVSYIEGADKLLKLEIDLGEYGLNEDGNMVSTNRQILSGIREYIEDINTLVGKQVPVLANLPPRKMRGLESNGMILAAGDGDIFTLLHPGAEVPPGTEVR